MTSWINTVGHLHDELKETPKQPNSKSLPTLLDSYLQWVRNQEHRHKEKTWIRRTAASRASKEERASLARSEGQDGEGIRGSQGRREPSQGGAEKISDQLLPLLIGTGKFLPPAR